MTTPASRPVATVNTQAQLLEGCRFCISQCELLLTMLSAEDFVLERNGSSVGTHLRHVLDRFQCFFNGLASCHIDYDARKRDQSIAASLDAAIFAFASISKRVDSIAGNGAVTNCLSVQESVHPEKSAVTISSTVERELMGLITHTTHHLAILALLMKSMGYTVDNDFGKAPSTILYERQQQST